MKIVIAGASTFAVGNYGDDAMLAALVQAIERRSPGSEITLLARHPSTEYEQYFRLKTIQNLEHESNDAASGRFFQGFNRGDSLTVLGPVLDVIRDADIVILAGNLLMEISGNSHLRGVSTYSSLLAVFATALRTPFAVFGLNVVEPVASKLVADQARHLVESAAAVSVREEAARQHLMSAGVNCESVIIGGDPAIGLIPELSLSGRTSPEAEPIVSVCLRSEYWKDSDLLEPSGRDERLWLDRIRGSGSLVRMIPNCVYTAGHHLEDDREAHRRLLGGESDGVELIEQELGLHETIHLLAESRLHITNRRHSAILAAHAGVLPVLVNTSLATHIKGFLPDLGLADLIADDLEGAAKIVAGMREDELLDRRLRLSEKVDAASAEVRSRTDSFVDSIAQVAK